MKAERRSPYRLGPRDFVNRAEKVFGAPVAA